MSLSKYRIHQPSHPTQVTESAELFFFPTNRMGIRIPTTQNYGIWTRLDMKDFSVKVKYPGSLSPSSWLLLLLLLLLLIYWLWSFFPACLYCERLIDVNFEQQSPSLFACLREGSRNSFFVQWCWNSSFCVWKQFPQESLFFFFFLSLLLPCLIQHVLGVTFYSYVWRWRILVP